MKNKKNLLIIGCIIIVICLIGSISDFEEDVNNNTNNMVDNQVTSNDIGNIPEIQEEKIYKDDETINKYIVLFNSINPDNKITTDMLSVYYHHGSEHKDQVTLVLDNLPVIITANYKDSISVNIDNSNKDNIVIKSLIEKFVKVFDSSITSEKIDKYLDSKGASSSINTYENVEYWMNKDANGERIEYIKITGKLEK